MAKRKEWLIIVVPFGLLDTEAKKEHTFIARHPEAVELAQKGVEQEQCASGDGEGAGRVVEQERAKGGQMIYLVHCGYSVDEYHQAGEAVWWVVHLMKLYPCLNVWLEVITEGCIDRLLKTI